MVQGSTAITGLDLGSVRRDAAAWRSIAFDLRGIRGTVVDTQLDLLVPAHTPYAMAIGDASRRDVFLVLPAEPRRSRGRNRVVVSDRALDVLNASAGGFLHLDLWFLDAAAEDGAVPRLGGAVLQVRSVDGAAQARAA